MPLRTLFNMGAPRGANGLDGPRQVAESSDTAPQGEREQSYQDLARMLGDAAKSMSTATRAMKSVAAKLKQTSGNDDEDDDHNEKGQKDVDPADLEEFDPDEPVKKQLKSQKSQLDLLRSDVRQLIEYIGSQSRGSGVPPNLTTRKAGTPEFQKAAVAAIEDNLTRTAAVVGAQTNYGAKISQAADDGVLNLSDTLVARRIASHIGIAKAGEVDIDAVRAEIAEASAQVQKIFLDS